MRMLAFLRRLSRIRRKRTPFSRAQRMRLAERNARFRAAQRAAAAEHAELRALAERFDTAMNNMSQGLCFFDGQQRLITCNRRYTEMYGLDPERVRPGIQLREVVALRFAAGSFPKMSPEQYLSWRDNVAVAMEPTDSTVELDNGRVFEIRHRPMPDRGWVATHEDVTEKFQAQQALASAKAAAEHAEAEARAAHTRLLDALDLVPEGLVIFDENDRYLLWNRTYQEMFDPAGDIITRGARFEDVLRVRLARGSFPEAAGREEAWIAERLAQHAKPQTRHEHQTSPGRWCRIEERRTEIGSIGLRVDITDLKEREEKFRLLFDSNPVPMWVFDSETLDFLAVNDAVVSHYGYTREQFLGMRLLDIRPPEDFDRVRFFAHSRDDSRRQGLLWRHRKADGNMIEVQTYGKSIDYQGRPAVMVAVIDVTERNRAERSIAHGATHDPLTDLPNRAALDAHFRGLLGDTHGRERAFAVLCVDLDRFKEINDLHGHSVGDAVLCEASRRLREACEGAFLARIGGDEFIAVAAFDQAGIAGLVERLEHVLDEDLAIDGHTFSIGLSVGIAMYPRDGRDATTLVANADAALYRAKHEGRGTTRVFTSDMDQQLRERRALERDLRGAIERGELRLEYQPQATPDGRIVGFEALLRWHHPLRGIVGPGEFIPIAEECGIIIELGAWVLRQACAEAASWRWPLKISVNVSAVQFRRGDLQGLVHAVLLETGLSPERLEIEITEGVLIENLSRAAAVLRNLKALGIRVALDDFGTGYSSLSYLQSFPLDLIKIDRQFVCNLEQRNDSIAIVRAVVGLAHGLSLPVVAEGVETAQQRDILVQEGCDELQGFFIGRPLPIERYAELTGAQARVAAATR
jgi:diguanylate cyclase (GGDEF)-like protein/PAS domain S-box-containing protein